MTKPNPVDITELHNATLLQLRRSLRAIARALRDDPTNIELLEVQDKVAKTIKAYVTEGRLLQKAVDADVAELSTEEIEKRLKGGGQ